MRNITGNPPTNLKRLLNQNSLAFSIPSNTVLFTPKILLPLHHKTSTNPLTKANFLFFPSNFATGKFFYNYSGFEVVQLLLIIFFFSYFLEK